MDWFAAAVGISTGLWARCGPRIAPTLIGLLALMGSGAYLIWTGGWIGGVLALALAAGGVITTPSYFQWTRLPVIDWLFAVVSAAALALAWALPY
jgi:hypothetical protein